MKRFLLFLLLFLPFIVSAQSLRGDWSGKLTLPMGKLRMVIHLTEEAGRWSATLDSPDQGAYGLRADEVHVSGDSLRLELRRLRLTYTAVRTQEDRLVGTFHQGGMSLPLDMERAKEKKDAPQASKSYTEEELSIPVSGTSVVLSGSLALPKTGQAPYPTLVLITGSGPQDRDETIFGCKPFLDITRRLTEAGFAVFRYDDRGVGKSTGVFLASSITDFVHDAEAVVAALRGDKSVKAQHIFLVGHSEGGYIAAKVASQDRLIAGVVSLAGPAFGMDRVLLDQMDALNLLAGKNEQDRATFTKANQEIYRLMQDKHLSLDEVKARAEKVIDPLLPVFSSDKSTHETIRTRIMSQLTPYLRELLNLDIARTWREVKCPVIGLFGEMDKQVLPSNAAELRRLQPKAQVQVFPKLNHLFLPSSTGSPMEYPTLEGHFSADALDFLARSLTALK
ncbi:alpha/beta hydrolase family protein [Porphyromonas sp.]